MLGRPDEDIVPVNPGQLPTVPDGNGGLVGGAAEALHSYKPG
jgi:hypothetical protein